MILRLLAGKSATPCGGGPRNRHYLRMQPRLVNVDVDVVTPEGQAVAKAIATYKVG
jgi:hypothetical protein